MGEYARASEVAARLQVTTRTVTKSNLPGAVKIGGVWRFHKATLDAHLAGLLAAPTPAERLRAMATVYKRARSPFWQCRMVLPDGSAVRRSTGETDKTKAAAQASEWEKALGASQSKGQMRFRDAKDLFLANAELKPATQKNYQLAFRNIHSKLGDFVLGELALDALEDYVKARMLANHHISARRELAFLSSLYSYARHLEGGPKFNLVKQLDKKALGLRKENKRTTWLTERQFEKLLSHAPNPMVRAMLVLAVETGLRSTELLLLEEAEIDLDRTIITLGNTDPSRTKTSIGRIVPLTQCAVDTLRDTLAHRDAELKRRKRLPCTRVFVNLKTGKGYTTLGKTWKRLARAAGFDDLHFHDLRHTFASWALQRGVAEKSLQFWLGHATPSMTGRYVHLVVPQLRTAAAIFSRGTLRDTLPADAREEHAG